MGALCMPTAVTTTTTTTNSAGFKTGTQGPLGSAGTFQQTPGGGYTVDEVLQKQRTAQMMSDGRIILCVAMAQTTTKIGMMSMNYYTPSHVESVIPSDTWLAKVCGTRDINLGSFITEINAEISKYAPWSTATADGLGKMMITEGYIQFLQAVCFKWNQSVFWPAGMEASVCEKQGSTLATVTGIIFRLLTAREQAEKRELFGDGGSGVVVMSSGGASEGVGKAVTGLAAATTSEAPPAY